MSKFISVEYAWAEVDRGEYNQSLGVKCSECGRRVRNRG
jgi:hypothetical protein